MDLTQIRKLIKMVDESSIAEFVIEEEQTKIKIRKPGANQSAQAFVPPPPVALPSAPQGAPAEAPKAEEPAEEKGHVVGAPMVGTFYAAPAPDADPFVKVGDRVAVGQTLCIVEAMKLMNEIESDVNGVIKKVLVENAKPVEYGQPLFLVDPA
ncbi:MAG: acetyl-CoA carboxylase biotin carboxyl carrier protein [Ignavibacteriales bacterium]|nr:acetyl-CoA carboxylase biotin carboxyl carrier protein [Ignavibacteriales bacterium]